jgi:DNA-binding XRE family transcriptional regulator
MNQAQFGNAIGVSFTTVNRWENGKSKPNLVAMKSIKAFCAANDIDYSKIEASWLGLHD